MADCCVVYNLEAMLLWQPLVWFPAKVVGWRMLWSFSSGVGQLANVCRGPWKFDFHAELVHYLYHSEAVAGVL